MRIHAIHVTRAFAKQFRKLPRLVQGAARAQEIIFRNDPFDRRLRTHKLHGKESDAWSFWVGRDYRIIFILLSEGEALFLAIGMHGIYR